MSAEVEMVSGEVTSGSEVSSSRSPRAFSRKKSVYGSPSRGTTCGELALDRVPLRADRREERRTGAAELGKERIDEHDAVAGRRCDQLRERIAERDPFAKIRRTLHRQVRRQLIDERRRNRQRADHFLRFEAARGAEMNQVALSVFCRERQRRYFVVIVIFGGEPEEDGGADAVRFVLALQLQQRCDLRERVKRAAGETNLLPGDERDAIAARPLLDFVVNEETPAAIRFDQRFDELR